MINELEPYVSKSIWIGPMNYIKKSDISTEDLPYYEKIRDITQKENLKKIYENLKDHKKIQFKDSFLNKIDQQIQAGPIIEKVSINQV